MMKTWNNLYIIYKMDYMAEAKKLASLYEEHIEDEAMIDEYPTADTIRETKEVVMLDIAEMMYGDENWDGSMGFLDNYKNLKLLSIMLCNEHMVDEDKLQGVKIIDGRTYEIMRDYYQGGGSSEDDMLRRLAKNLQSMEQYVSIGDETSDIMVLLRKIDKAQKELFSVTRDMSPEDIIMKKSKIMAMREDGLKIVRAGIEDEDIKDLLRLEPRLFSAIFDTQGNGELFVSNTVEVVKILMRNGGRLMVIMSLLARSGSYFDVSGDLYDNYLSIWNVLSFRLRSRDPIERDRYYSYLLENVLSVYNALEGTSTRELIRVLLEFVLDNAVRVYARYRGKDNSSFIATLLELYESGYKIPITYNTSRDETISLDLLYFVLDTKTKHISYDVAFRVFSKLNMEEWLSLFEVVVERESNVQGIVRIINSTVTKCFRVEKTKEGMSNYVSSNYFFYGDTKYIALFYMMFFVGQVQFEVAMGYALSSIMQSKAIVVDDKIYLDSMKIFRKLSHCFGCYSVKGLFLDFAKAMREAHVGNSAVVIFRRDMDPLSMYLARYVKGEDVSIEEYWEGVWRSPYGRALGI
jgi:hypothetical protein